MKKYLVCILMLTPIFSWARSITSTVVDSYGQVSHLPMSSYVKLQTVRL